MQAKKIQRCCYTTETWLEMVGSTVIKEETTNTMQQQQQQQLIQIIKIAKS